MSSNTAETKRFARISPFGIWAIAYACAAVVYAIHVSSGFSIPYFVITYALFGLLVLVQKFSIPVGDVDSLKFETVFVTAFALTYPFPTVVWALLCYGVILVYKYPESWDKALLNANNFATSAFVARYAFDMVSHHRGFDVTLVIPIFVAAVGYFTTNVLVFSISIYVMNGLSDLRAYLAGIRGRFLAIYGLQILIGLLLAAVIQTAGLSGVLLFTGLIVLVAYSYRDYFRMANHFKGLSIRDELTSVYNHRWVQTWMDERIVEQNPFAVLMIDIDHFKRYNEVWGHLRGDEALRLVSDIIHGSLSNGEEVARYSGEEFFVVMPNGDLDSASERAEQIRQSIEETAFPGAEKMPGKKITVSLGIATFPEMAANKKDLLMMVDDALYKGKFTGRNKVSIYTSVIDELKSELTLESAEHDTINTIKVFLAILNSKDRYTFAHTERDARYVEALARKLGMAGDKLLYLRFGAFLHDIGKVEIPQEVLTKRGPLTRDEWVIMKSHVELGVKIIETIPSLHSCIPTVLHHHERFDGTGYPHNLVGDEIPLEARILTIADSFDAMTTSRPYQRRRSMDEAFEELRLCAGKQFDAELVEPFISVVKEMGLLSNEPDDEDDIMIQP